MFIQLKVYLVLLVDCEAGWGLHFATETHQCWLCSSPKYYKRDKPRLPWATPNVVSSEQNFRLTQFSPQIFTSTNQMNWLKMSNDSQTGGRISIHIYTVTVDLRHRVPLRTTPISIGIPLSNSHKKPSQNKSELNYPTIFWKKVSRLSLQHLQKTLPKN